MKTKNSLLACMAIVLSLSSCDNDETEKTSYAINSESSLIEWKGAGNNIEHTGSFSVSGDELQVEDNRIVGGTFNIPIASIQNFDLPEEVKPILLNHLQSADFFNMEVYPEAAFSITSVDPKLGTEGTNYVVKGKFTLIGITLPIEFPAKVSFSGNQLITEADFTIDRTEWGMDYAADPELGEHHIFPLVNIHLKVVGDKK
jgi:polyisoprenoid-binding protein YceI